MKKIAQKLKQVMKDESAQGATEYILLIVIAVGLVVIFGPEIKKFVEAKVAEIGGGFDKIKVP